MKKRCPKCGKTLCVSRFSKNSSTKDGLQSWCKSCKAAKHQERKEHNCNRVYSRKRKLADWLKVYKKQLTCERCGEDHHACIQFHHIDSSEKDIDVSRAISNGWSIARLEKEISKCEVLCANCHFKEHDRLKSLESQDIASSKPESKKALGTE